MIFAKKNALFKLENINNFDTYFHIVKTSFWNCLMINVKQKHAKF